MPFWRMFFNTVLYAGCVTAGQVFFCSLAGYAFARLQFRGRDTLFVLYLGTLMVPLTVTVIPQFILMRIAGLDRHAVGDDRAGPVRQRVRHLSDAPVLPNAPGRSRGSRDPRRLLAVADLLADPAAARRPAVMVLAVLTWVNVWNDFLWPLLMIQRNSLATLTLGLVRLRGEYVARWPVIMAASMLIMLPLVIIYAVAQRSFIRGIAVTGLGG